ANLPEIRDGSIDLADFNNNGLSDVLITGNSNDGLIAQVWKNEADGSFSKVTEFTGVRFSSAIWSDINNDGFPDIILTGNQSSTLSENIPVTSLYLNNGEGGFTDITPETMTSFERGSVTACDFNRNGFTDLFFTGRNDAGERTTEIYHNTGDGDFVLVGKNLIEPVTNGSAACADFNGDGYPDLLITGSSGLTTAIASIYQNNGSFSFTRAFDLTGIENSDGVWGDINNDGFPDILIAGRDRENQVPVTQLFLNSMTGVLPGVPVPSGLDSFVDEQGAVVLTWLPAGDTEDFTYNLRIGTESGGIDVKSPLANPETGTRYIAAMGNVQKSKRWEFSGIEPGIYYWSLQAIDPALRPSAFAGEQLLAWQTQPVLRSVNFSEATDNSIITNFEISAAGLPTSALVRFGLSPDNLTEELPVAASLSNTALNTESVLLEGLEPGIVYYLAVFAENDLGSAVSDTVSFTTELITSIDDDPFNELPEKVTLHQNYPNPFNPSTVIRYTLPESRDVKLVVYDLLGRQITVLVNDIQPAGNHEILFDANKLSSGIYIYRLESGEMNLTRKMMLVK
ncbi:MAG: FG-GAP-like repeat-containing protein, partial [Balneolaceae bacterium]